MIVDLNIYKTITMVSEMEAMEEAELFGQKDDDIPGHLIFLMYRSNNTGVIYSHGTCTFHEYCYFINTSRIFD